MSERGKQAYEQDVEKRPAYPDGTPRPTWDKLSEIAQWSWNRPVEERHPPTKPPELSQIMSDTAFIGEK